MSAPDLDLQALYRNLDEAELSGRCLHLIETGDIGELELMLVRSAVGFARKALAQVNAFEQRCFLAGFNRGLAEGAPAEGEQ